MMVDFNSLLKNHVDVYLINGVRAGYIDVRIDRKTVPDSIYVYEVRDTSDDGGWYIGNVEDFVLVNHAGTFLTYEPLTMLHPDWSARGIYIDLSDKNEPWEYLAEGPTLEEFINER